MLLNFVSGFKETVPTLDIEIMDFLNIFAFAVFIGAFSLKDLGLYVTNSLDEYVL